jgi:hypothetical protein
MSAGDYRLFRSENAQNRSPETGGQFAKARHWRAFLQVSGTVSPSAGLPGWRRSADRTRLHANSLLTGNFTGNFAISGLLDGFRSKKPLRRSRFSQFPAQINRENISRNREFFAGIREFKVTGLGTHGRKLPFLARLFLRGSNATTAENRLTSTDPMQLLRRSRNSKYELTYSNRHRLPHETNND